MISRDTVTSIESNQTIGNLLFNICTCTMSWINLICRQTLNNIQSIYQSCNVFFTHCLQYRAWARPEAVNQTEYALSVGTKILTYFENYFGIPFPLPKQGIAYQLSVCILYFFFSNKVVSCYQKKKKWTGFKRNLFFFYYFKFWREEKFILFNVLVSLVSFNFKIRCTHHSSCNFLLTCIECLFFTYYNSKNDKQILLQIYMQNNIDNQMS